MTACIYQITNLVNDKIYVGVHCDSANTPYMGSGLGIQRAIKKYGKQNFRKDVLMTFQSTAEAYELEGLVVDEAFVKRSDTYNRCIGGIGGVGGMESWNKGKSFSSESRQKMSVSATGRRNPHSAEWRAKVSAAKMGHPVSEACRLKLRAANLGKVTQPCSLETRRKISEAKRHQVAA